MDLFKIYTEMDDRSKLNYKFASDKYNILRIYEATKQAIELQILQLSVLNFKTQGEFVIRHEQLKSNLHLMNSFIALSDSVKEFDI